MLLPQIPKWDPGIECSVCSSLCPCAAPNSKTPEALTKSQEAQCCPLLVSDAEFLNHLIVQEEFPAGKCL